MRLQDLADSAADLAISPSAGDVEILSLTADSRSVRPGALFAALPGANTDGRAFIADAITRGAAAVLMQTGAHAAVRADP